MKILVIGQGGREHALVHSFVMSPSVSEVHVIPGSNGMSREALCHPLDWRDFESIVQFCLKNDISFVFIGPEDPLVAGLSDFLRNRGILVVGPSQEAAHLEGSKVFAKKFMQAANIPTAFFEEVYSVEDAIRLSGRFTPPYVLKADGLAAGKGVFICQTLEELRKAAEDIFERQTLGAAGVKALLEQYTTGWELSYLVITNGSEFTTLPLSQDHKRLLDKDLGPNTGGMGTIAPIRITEELQKRIDEQIIKPTLENITKQNIIYRGVLYFGLMINERGPSLLEYNCRFGDPETQVILPLIENDLGLLFHEVSKGKCPDLKSKNLHSACVILAAPGYPDNPQKGLEIVGEIEAQTNSSYFIHSGSKFINNTWLTNGGRVLCAIGIGSTQKEALTAAYNQSNLVSWEGLQKRTDIGQKLH
jgi:phosphoribosylamine--glycine ligase